jgi:hypothetical protein
MLLPAPTPSRRLVRAATAEREALARHRARLTARRDELRAELDEVEAALREVDERDVLLHRLVSPAPAAAVPDGPAGCAAPAPHPALTEAPAGRGAPAPGPPARALAPAAAPLRGPAIRLAAVRVMLEHPGRPDALHYREWFAMLRDAGHVVAGKDPLAVFLTQLSRSPVVRKGTQSGVYELDRGAPHRLRAALDALHDRLRALTAETGATADLAAVRTHRAEVTAEITRTEKMLEEAEALLTRPASAAAGQR